MSTMSSSLGHGLCVPYITAGVRAACWTRAPAGTARDHCYLLRPDYELCYELQSAEAHSDSH